MGPLYIMGIFLLVGGAFSTDTSYCPPHLSKSDLYAYGDYCLKVHYGNWDWETARSICIREGGDLAQPRTPGMQEYIRVNLLPQKQRSEEDGFWIGATDLNTESHWRWVSGDPSMPYSNWEPGQGPSQSGFLFVSGDLEDCALMRIEDGFRWHDYPCSNFLYHYSFICQHKKLPQTTHHVNPTKLTTRYVPPTTTKYVPPTTTKYVPPTTTKYVPPTTTKYVPPTTTRFQPETYSSTRFVPWTERTTMLSERTRSSTVFVPQTYPPTEPTETDSPLPTTTPEPAPETPLIPGGGGGDPFSGGFASSYSSKTLKYTKTPNAFMSHLKIRFSVHIVTVQCNVQAMKTVQFCLGLLVSAVFGAPSDECPSNLGSSDLYTYGDLCIKVHYGNYDWVDARHQCQREGGDLIQIRDAGMQQFLQRTLSIQRSEDTGFWIGASDSESESHWKWVSGDPTMTYSHWNPDQGPNQGGFIFSDGGHEDCALMKIHDEFRWHDYECSLIFYHFSFICQYDKGDTQITNENPGSTTVFIPYPTAAPTTALSAPTDECPPNLGKNDLYTYGDFCIKVHYGNYDWVDARHQCQREGGDLIQIRDAGMQQFLQKTLSIQRSEDTGFWIGASDSESESHWKWVSGDPTMTYSHWSPDQGPNQGGFFFADGGHEDCALMKIHDQFRWHDYECSLIFYHYSFICQYAKNDTQNTHENPGSTTVFLPQTFPDTTLPVTDAPHPTTPPQTDAPIPTTIPDTTGGNPTTTSGDEAGVVIFG
ncbi:uncharacterized protein LOC111134481 [Crassostrea virginica]